MSLWKGNLTEAIALRHAESHTVASHNDTTGTGAELNELTDGSTTALHSHAVGGMIALQATIRGNAYVGNDIIVARISKAMTITKVRLGVGKTAPTGDTLIGDVHYHATDPTAMTTIFTTGPGTNRPEIAIGAFTDDSGAPDVTVLAEGGWVGFSIDQIGSTLPGENVVFELLV